LSLFLGVFFLPIAIVLILYFTTNQTNIPPSNNIPNSNTKPVLPKSFYLCKLAPITVETKPDWYAVIEIGAKGIKPIAIKIKGGVESIEFDDDFDTQNVTPIKEVNVFKVANAVCETMNTLHNKYGNLPVYIVGSSSLAITSHRDKLVTAIYQSVNKQVDFITAEQEASYLGKGIWSSPKLPNERHCESAVLSIGSGNIKGGYIENCDPTVKQGKNEVFRAFEVPNFGTVKFTEQTQKKIENQPYVSFIEAAKKTRVELEARLEIEVRSSPELINGKKRFYLEGGSVWVMSTLLCLDCPQYDHRSFTDDQDKYTVIKAKDIDSFYQYVTTSEKDICDTQKENPYLKIDMDGIYKGTLRQEKIDKQKIQIQKVCRVFSPQDLISAAEILRAIKNKMNFEHSDTHIFFMQNNLYTWSRQYLIEKIEFEIFNSQD
jgi:hypothetical protein